MYFVSEHRNELVEYSINYNYIYYNEKKCHICIIVYVYTCVVCMLSTCIYYSTFYFDSGGADCTRNVKLYLI